MSQEPKARDAEVADFRAAVLNKLTYAVGKDPEHAFDHDWFEAIALAARDHMVDHWMDHTRQAYRRSQKRVYYLSLEFLIGRLLYDSLSNLGLLDVARDALEGLNVDLERIRLLEPDAALGNGGLGRLAACFMESMSTLGIAAHGYGIRYEHGLFRQAVVDGWQQEQTENWLDFGNPWEFERAEVIYPISFGGSVETVHDASGSQRQVWWPGETVRAVAYDTPVVGWRGSSVNTLRLWRARALEELHLERFNAGDHLGAVAEVARAESISRVLYPADSTEAGQELRLRQEYFFVSASLQDLLRRHLNMHKDLLNLPDAAAIQLNDTHPSIAVAELMRLLVDQHEVPWEKAWELTVGTLAYTNHTLLPEALERWPVRLFEKVLPRHIEIIYEINRRFLVEQVDVRWPGDVDKKRKLSIIEEGHEPMVRMGHLSVVGSFRVNGVAEVHSALVKSDLFPEMVALWPDKFTNITNGVTPRRWLKACNKRLSKLLDNTIGTDWPTDLTKLSALQAHADDPAMQDAFMAIKQQNKADLADVVKNLTGIAIDPHALFDVQIKRLHEYKRQHLNLLHILALYRRILQDPDYDMVPRVFFFGAKAAPGYKLAKDIIYAINKIADKIILDIDYRKFDLFKKD